MFITIALLCNQLFFNPKKGIKLFVNLSSHYNCHISYEVCFLFNFIFVLEDGYARFRGHPVVALDLLETKLDNIAQILFFNLTRFFCVLT